MHVGSCDWFLADASEYHPDAREYSRPFFRQTLQMEVRLVKSPDGERRMETEVPTSSSRRGALLACGYGVGLGVYFGLVLGLRINPDFLDHSRGWAYAVLIVLFGVGLHSCRKLSALTSWAAYSLCGVTHVLVAAGCNRLAIFRMPPSEVMACALIIIGFFACSGLLAQGIGWTVRRHLLPSEAKTNRFMIKLLPWFPLIVLLAMTLHTVERLVDYGHIRTQRGQYGEQIGHLEQVAISLVAQGRTVRVQDGKTIATAALHQETYAPKGRIEVILVFENRGQESVAIQSPRAFAEFFTVEDEAGNKLPFHRPREWEVVDGAVPGIRIAPGEHTGRLVPLRPYFSLIKAGAYTLRLNWRGKESAPLQLTIR